MFHSATTIELCRLKAKCDIQRDRQGFAKAALTGFLERGLTIKEATRKMWEVADAALKAREVKSE